jgi:tetratricopeptide (TPR) repeat protein
MMLLPSWMFVLRFPARRWRDPAVAPLAAMATLLGLYSVDCLANGFMNLSYVVASGGLIGTALSPGKTQRARRNNSHGLDPADAGQVPAIVDEAVEMPVAASRPSTGVNSDGDSSTTPQGRLVDRYRQLARTLRAQGQSAEAKACLTYAFDLLTKLAKAQPDVRELQRQRWDCANDLAWLLLNEHDPAAEDLLLAIQLAKQATTAHPEKAVYWNTLGAAHCCAGDTASAVPALERSMALSHGGTPFDYVFLSLAHSRIGQQVEARYWLARTDAWTERHGSDHPDLPRLIDQARSVSDR